MSETCTVYVCVYQKGMLTHVHVHVRACIHTHMRIVPRRHQSLPSHLPAEQYKTQGEKEKKKAERSWNGLRHSLGNITWRTNFLTSYIQLTAHFIRMHSNARYSTHAAANSHTFPEACLSPPPPKFAQSDIATNHAGLTECKGQSESMTSSYYSPTWNSM